MTNENSQNAAVEQAPANQLSFSGDDLTQLIKVSDSKALEKMKPALSLNSDYFQLKSPGEKIRGIFWGLTKIQVTNKASSELKEMIAVQILRDGKILLNAGVNLVNTVERSAVRRGTPVEITFSREDGQVKVYDVNLLV